VDCTVDTCWWLYSSSEWIFASVVCFRCYDSLRLPYLALTLKKHRWIMWPGIRCRQIVWKGWSLYVCRFICSKADSIYSEEDCPCCLEPFSDCVEVYFYRCWIYTRVLGPMFRQWANQFLILIFPYFLIPYSGWFCSFAPSVVRADW